MTWLRLEAAVFQDPQLRRLGGMTACAWVGILTMTKLHDRRGGLLPKTDLTPETLLDHMGLDRPIPDQFHVTVTPENGENSARAVPPENGRLEHCQDVTVVTVTCLDAALKALIANGFLIDAGSDWQIKNWKRFQMDPTAADRKRDQRERKRHGRHRDNGLSRCVTDVTATGRTLRDDERSESSSSSGRTPLSGGAGGAPPSPAPPLGAEAAPAPASAPPPPARRSPDGPANGNGRHALPDAADLAALLAPIADNPDDPRQPQARGLLGLRIRETDWRDRADVLLHQPGPPPDAPPPSPDVRLRMRLASLALGTGPDAAKARELLASTRDDWADRASELLAG